MSWLEKQQRELAKANAASAAHPTCSALYRSKLTAAETRRMQRVAEIQARHAAFLGAANDTYERVLDATADDDKRNECNSAYRAAVTKADRSRDEEIAAAVAQETIDRDAAYRWYRASPGYMGE